MSADLTTCAALVARSDSDITGAVSAETALIHVAIDAHPAGAQGPSHGLLVPAASHGPEGVPGEAPLKAGDFPVCERCDEAWPG
jgi:hypothetical protein